MQAIKKPHVVKGDTVQLIRGKEKGKRGVVKSVSPKAGTALVEGLNVVKRHTKQGVGGAKSAGIFEKEAPLPISTLMLVDPKTSLPTRMRRTTAQDGTSLRIAVRSGEELIQPGKGR